MTLISSVDYLVYLVHHLLIPVKTSDLLQEGEYVLLEEREFWGTRLNFMALCKTLATLTEKAFMEMNF